VLTEEQRTEIQREVESRILELLQPGAKLHQSMEGPAAELSTVLDYAARIASAISAAHAGEAVRQDIKPDNLIIDRSGPVKLLDFGVANIEPPEINPDSAEAAMEVPTQPGTSLPSSQEKHPLKPLVRVVARAVEVLGTSEKALRWLNAPIRSLGDQAPVSLLSSPEGMARVEDALGQIEHGVW